MTDEQIHDQAFSNTAGNQMAQALLTICELQGQLAVANATIAKRDARIKELEDTADKVEPVNG